MVAQEEKKAGVGREKNLSVGIREPILSGSNI